MEEFLKKETIKNLIMSIVILVLGVILIIKPVTILETVISLLEAVLIVVGIITIMNYIKVESKYDVFSLGFVQGVGCILISIFLIGNPNLLASIFPVALGIWMVIGSFTKIQIAIKLSYWGQKEGFLYIIFAVLMFTIGIIAICNPFNTLTVMVQMLGIGIATYSALDLLQDIGIISFLNKMTKN